MVKIEEDQAEYDGDAGGLGDAARDRLPTRVKEEEGQPSSSCHLRSQFIGMGFSAMLVDKVLQKHGDKDSDTILEHLLSYPALQKSGSASSSSLGSLFDSDNEENVSLSEPRNQEVEDIKPDPDSCSGKRSYLLRTMNFTQDEVDFTFKMLGEEAPLEQLVDHIVNAQLEGSSREKDATSEVKAQSLFGVMKKTLGLLEMGFTEEEVSSAIDSFGQEATITDLADHILAKRIANSIEQKEVKVESEFLDETETEFSTYRTSWSAVNYDDDVYGGEHTRVKRAKTIFLDDRDASSSRSSNSRFVGCSSTTNGFVKEEPEVMTPGCRANFRGDVANPPYFVYANTVEVPKHTWRQLSEFLFNVEPEFIDSQFFSALTQKGGYIHNLPLEIRRAVVPKSPMTIEEALPFTRQWWPSWDTRKHISPVTIDAAPSGIEQTCEELGRMVRDSRGVLSQERQKHIMYQCKALNLIWVGREKLRPLEPRQVERILGYPHDHTNLFGLSQKDRFSALRSAFQTDTLAYILSVLKDRYPDGMNVLSIYSGIGGAEVTLHRLGIHLKCVVSVEESDANRKILRRWWGKTEQTGELRQYPSTGKLTIDVIRNLIAEFGGFDLIIGGNYSSVQGGTTINTTMGMEMQHFFEFSRVVKRVRAALRDL